MDVLSPVKVLRQKFFMLFVPAIPIAFLLAVIVATNGVPDNFSTLLNRTDSYLAMDVHLSAANITAFDNISTDIQIPLVRLGGIAEKTDIRELFSPDPFNFILIFVTLFLAFISYAMVSRAVYSMKSGAPSAGGLRGITPAAIALSLVAVFLMLFVSSFSLGGFRLLLVMTFGIYFTFSIPHAAAGKPFGESILQGFMFMSQSMGKVVVCFIGCMGAALMIPIALVIFTAPLIMNVEPGMTVALRLVLGLLAVVFGLFYQMALCASAVFDKVEKAEKAESAKDPKENKPA
jgi:hypothetical protein